MTESDFPGVDRSTVQGLIASEAADGSESPASESAPIYDASHRLTTYEGFATSCFQNSPNPNDIWGECLRRGISPDLRKLWEKRNSRKFRRPGVFQAAVASDFEEKLDKQLAHYDKQGVEQGRVFTLELDMDLLNHTAEDPRHSDAIFGALATVIRRAANHQTRVDVVINQYANEPMGQEETYTETARQLVASLPGILQEKGLTASELDYFSATEFRRWTLEDWHGYIDKIAEQGANTFRLSSEWSQVMQEENQVNNEGMDLLADIIKYAKQKGLRAALCMHHYTLPLWVEQRGGWTSPQMPDLFTQYSIKTLEALQERTALPDSVITINEPMAFLVTGYLDGSWPPYKRGHIGEFLAAFNQTIDAHCRLYDAIKGHQGWEKLPVGFTYNLPCYDKYFYPDGIIARAIEKGNESWVHAMLRRAVERGSFPFDFFGLQYYNMYKVGMTKQTMGANSGNINAPARFDPFPNGWPRFPEGLLCQIANVNRWLLQASRKMHQGQIPDTNRGESFDETQVQHQDAPVEEGFIDTKKHPGKQVHELSVDLTEIGVPTEVDPRGEMKILEEAIGAALEYTPLHIGTRLYWTLMDNFEWVSGYRARFGVFFRDGNPKPKGNVRLINLNLRVERVGDDLLKLMRELDRYAIFLDQQLEIEPDARTAAEMGEFRQTVAAKAQEIKRFLRIHHPILYERKIHKGRRAA